MNKSLNFIYFLHVSHWILLIVYLLFVLNIKFKYRDESKEYIRSLNTIYTIGIGLLLIVLRFPALIDIKNKKTINAISKLMFSAGIIVLSTLRPEDITQIHNLFKSTTRTIHT